MRIREDPSIDNQKAGEDRALHEQVEQKGQQGGLNGRFKQHSRNQRGQKESMECAPWGRTGQSWKDRGTDTAAESHSCTCPHAKAADLPWVISDVCFHSFAFTQPRLRGQKRSVAAPRLFFSFLPSLQNFLLKFAATTLDSLILGFLILFLFLSFKSSG